MTNEGNHDDVVTVALAQCKENFLRGVNAHGDPTLAVDIEAIRFLRSELEGFFEDNLKKKGRQWHGPKGEGDGWQVTRVAFYMGAIAAFHAHAGHRGEVKKDDVDQALEYVKAHCVSLGTRGREFRVQYVYCQALKDE